MGGDGLTNRRFFYIQQTILLAAILGFILITGCMPAWEETPADMEAEPFGHEEGEGFPEEVDDPFDRDTDEKISDESEPLPEKEAAGEIEPAEDLRHLDNGDLRVISDGDYLFALVTKETTLKSDYAPSDLKPVPAYMNPSYYMLIRKVALEPLRSLWYAAEAEGIILSIRSAYRCYNTQHNLFEDYAARHGKEEANRFSARPGQSEHQLGTTVDFGGTDVDFTAEFANTDQGRWLAENAHLFGFALSYPEGKEDITGYIFEPWHYRYIGIDAAREWFNSGKTLKEFLKTKPQSFE